MVQFKHVRWEGLEGLGQEALNSLRPKALDLVKQAVLLGEGELKTTLTGRRSGRTYKVSKTGRLHIASVPGEAPAVLWGNLRNSVGHSQPRWEGDAVSAEFGVGLGVRAANPEDDPETYAARLEFGGTDSRGIYIAPRPYMAPTEERVRPIIEALFEEGI